MRIIPIDEILSGGHAHNPNHEGHGSFALFGALLSMLSGGLTVRYKRKIELIVLID